jgi:arginine/serine-rich splicing factor 4/5/6
MSSTRIYLGRLANSARERDVERFFKGYGKIREIVLKEGYGFIEFDESRDAEDAVYDLNGKELCGDRVIVEHAKPPGSRRDGGGGRMRSGYGGGFGGDRGYGGGGGRYGFSRAPPMRGARNPPPLRTDYRILVDNISSKVSWQDLKDFFRQAGDVTYADAHKIRQYEGVVEYATSSDMKAAMSKLDGAELCGRKIKLTEDRPSSRRRSRSRSRSDSRSRSRSRSRRSRSRSRSDSRSRSRSVSKRAASRSPRRSRSHSKEQQAPPPAEAAAALPTHQRMSGSRSRSRSRSSRSAERD